MACKGIETIKAKERAKSAQAAYKAVPSHANRQAYERAVIAWNVARGACKH